MKFTLNQFLFFVYIFSFSLFAKNVDAQKTSTLLRYTVSMNNTSGHYYHVEFYCAGWNKNDSLDFKMPRWMPGYYQIMDYAKAVEHFHADYASGENILVSHKDFSSWKIYVSARKPFKLSYDVLASKRFVANSFLDSTHAYIVPPSLFLFIDGHINSPVSLTVLPNRKWNKIATGLDPVPGKTNVFYAEDFDVLYDCPILVGNLEELPSFKIKGIEHRFIGYNLGSFDREKFMSKLKKTVEAGISVIGDIPYKQYTFIAIGPGRGGIEHLNNSTVGFDGNELNSDASVHKVLNFLAHEYFHHYNIKRIRPFELGPFDYNRENRTNLLWVSEGLSVYYEYMMVKRAGLASEEDLFHDFEKSINSFENNQGRFYQSLAQASYETWSDGPFGKQGEGADKSISYYDKGPAVGLIIDFAIRQATKNEKSLDDVMRNLYWKYYKNLKRGFTDAEFQQTCETVAGISLSDVFEYVNTTKELNYNAYLKFAGLQMLIETDSISGKRKLSIHRLDNLDAQQLAILNSWLGN
jgi:predicted metalloprotease with PDZ domain